MTFCLESGLIDWNRKKKKDLHAARAMFLLSFFVIAHCGNSDIGFLCRLPETFMSL